MIKKAKITKEKLISMLYDYARIHKQPSARIMFQGRRVNLYLGDRKNKYYNLTMQQAYDVLKERTVEKAVSKGNGYIGRSMSVNAKQAYERGFKPLSRIRSSEKQKTQMN